MDKLAQKILGDTETFRQALGMQGSSLEFCQPAVEFEKKHRLTGIAGYYVLPEGLSSAALQTYALALRDMTEQGKITIAAGRDKMTEVWDALVSRNPPLQEIKQDPQKPPAVFHMIMGVASAYNVDDIRYFISESGQVWKKTTETVEFKRLKDVFNKCASRQTLEGNLRWAASPKTLKLIHDQFQEKLRMNFVTGKNSPPAIGP